MSSYAKSDVTVAALAAEIGIDHVNDLVRFIRSCREDREMRPYIKAVHPTTLLTNGQLSYLRELAAG